jgi:hypothetical protein
MTAQSRVIADASSFGEAQAIITEWLGAGKVKPGAPQFDEIRSIIPRWVAASNTVSEKLEGVALVGRLWSLASWRAVPSVPDWTKEITRSLVGAMKSDQMEEVSEWGGADERRFASNALEVADIEQAREIATALFLTESARKSTKATSHHLECLRRQGVTLEAIVLRAPALLRRISRRANETNNSPLFMFENFVAAAAAARWQDAEVGHPDFTSLVEAMSTPAQRSPVELRDSAAEGFLSLLDNFRLSTRRRKDLEPGYAPVVALLGWFPGRRFPSSLDEPVAAILRDLEQDIVGRLELGRREGRLRELHLTIAGEKLSELRLARAAEVRQMDEQSQIWMRTGRWLELSGGDAAIAETAAQHLDPLIAELLIDFGQLATLRDGRVGDALRRMEALGRARSMSMFGAVGEVVSFDAARHHLRDHQLEAGARVAIIRPGVVRSRASGETVVVKAVVRNADF